MPAHIPKGKFEIRQEWLTPRAHAGEVTYPAGTTFYIPCRREYQLFLLYEGEAVVELDGRKYALTLGAVTLLQPGMTEHWMFSKTETTRHGWFNIFPEVADPDLWARLEDAPLVLNCLPEMQALLDIIEQLPPEIDEDVERMLCRYIQTAFEHYLFYAKRVAGNEQGDSPQSVRNADAYIHAHYADEITLDDLAQAAGVCSKHLIRLFKKYHQATPMRYLWAHRVERGANLLRCTELSIQNISDQVGFQNPYHFSRMFKQVFGCSPREYRKK